MEKEKFNFNNTDPEDGLPASNEDLKELRGRTDESGFVPQDPRQAADYYNKKRYNTLNRYNLEHGEAIELFRYYNGKLLEIIANNSKVKGFGEGRLYDSRRQENLGDKFEEIFRQRILEVLKTDHYELTPGLNIATTESFEKEFLNYSFKLTITGLNEDNGDGKSEYDFNLTDKNNHRAYIGKISVDTETDEVKVNLLPTIVSEKDEKPNLNIVPDASQRVKSLMGLVYLLRIPEYLDEPYKGGRLPDDGKLPEGVSPVDVGKEVETSIMPFLRRTVDDLTAAWEQAEVLLASLSQEKKEILEKKIGNLSLKVHYVVFTNDSKSGRWSETFRAYIGRAGLVGSCLPNRSQVEALTDKALDEGGRAIISVNGSWVPPELENSPAGKAKRPHFRRTTQGVILVSNRNEDRIIKKLFNKRAKGENISFDESRAVDDFLKRHNLENFHDVVLETVDAKEDKNISTDNNRGRRGGKYVARPKKFAKN